MDIFGFEIKKKKSKEETLASVVPPTDYDGAAEVSESQLFAFDFEPSYSSDEELINLYRKMATNPDVLFAIEEIVNDAIVFSDNENAVDITFSENCELSDNIRKKIIDEFNTILGLYKFSDVGDDIFKNWYVDGRIYFHLVISDEKGKQKEGLKDIRFIDPRHIEKKKIIKTEKRNGVEVVTGTEEFFVYTTKDSNGKKSKIKLPVHTVAHATSGVFDTDGKRVVSYLHQAMKLFNMLNSLEDSLVVYRIARAPERRVFYVDTGNLPKTRAEQYMKSIINRNKNKFSYDSSTGQIKDKRHVMSMLEDIWLPRREGSRGTEVETLQSSAQLGEMDDILYFSKKFNKALRIPVSRLEDGAQFNLARSSEITRDEIKFAKFITKLRKRFSKIFKQALKQQLILKAIIAEDEWKDISECIKFDYNSDSHFEELKNNEILNGRIELLGNISDYVGRYYSEEWVMKNVLMMTDEEIKEQKKKIKEEGSDKKTEADQGF